MLCEFPEVVERAAREYAPHHICTYVFALGQAFNTYYATNQIIQAGELTGYRLLLTQAVAQVMKNSLTLLGIPNARDDVKTGSSAHVISFLIIIAMTKANTSCPC